MTRIPSLLALILLTSCASAAQAPDTAATPAAHPSTGITAQADAHMITLNIGEQATLADNSRLTYLSLINDSRCPPDVQCVWAGDAEIQLRWQPSHGGGAKEVSLHTSPMRGAQTEVTLGVYRIKLESLARGIAPAATLSITPATP